MIPIPGSREWLAGGQTGNPTPKCTGLRNARWSPAREWVRSQRADNWNIYYWNDRQSYSPSPSMRAGDVVPPASCSPNRGQPNIMQVVPSAELISQIKNLSGGYRFLLGSGSLICSFRIQQGQTRVFFRRQQSDSLDNKRGPKSWAICFANMNKLTNLSCELLDPKFISHH